MIMCHIWVHQMWLIPVKKPKHRVLEPLSSIADKRNTIQNMINGKVYPVS